MQRTTVNPLTPSVTQHLVVHGLYRYTRNPMYVGLLIILFGWGLRLGSVSPFVLIPFFVWIITTLQILPEEKVLLEKFGSDYEKYCKRIPRWL